jgi:hypothetical protein
MQILHGLCNSSNHRVNEGLLFRVEMLLTTVRRPDAARVAMLATEQRNAGISPLRYGRPRRPPKGAVWRLRNPPAWKVL